MNMKLKLIAAALAFVAAGSAQAAMQGATSGNGELLVNFRYYDGANDTGGNDMSAVFDLGVTMDTALSTFNVKGFKQTWNLNDANYGSAWNDLLTFAAVDANIEFNVIALDNTNKNTTGGSRYLTTYDAANFVSLQNTALNGFDNMNKLVTANNSRGTHSTQTNGASTATSSESAVDAYFGKVNGLTDGDNWAGATTAITTKNLGTAQNFWYLTTSSTSSFGAATKTAFGVDMNGATAGGFEFGEWSVDLAANTITYTAPVPEPETYALMLAGLGLVGFMARRRKAA